MIVLNVVVKGAKQIAARWFAKSVTLDKQLDLVRRENAEILLRKIQANASGRPGPNVITGAYRASWHIEEEGDSTVVTTGAPQAARLEYGFVGVDSIGRHYNQPPFPHMNPAADEIEAAFVADVVRVAVMDL